MPYDYEIKWFSLTDEQKEKFPNIDKYLNKNPIACGWYIKNIYVPFSEKKEYTFSELQKEYFNHNKMLNDRKDLLEKKRSDNVEPLTKKLCDFCGSTIIIHNCYVSSVYVKYLHKLFPS
jgi:hypothetical protein